MLRKLRQKDLKLQSSLSYLAGVRPDRTLSRLSQTSSIKIMLIMNQVQVAIEAEQTLEVVHYYFYLRWVEIKLLLF